MSSIAFNILGKVFRSFRKIILVIAVYFVVINLFLVFTKGDTPSQPVVNLVDKNREEIYKVINDPKLQKTDQGKVVVFAYRFFTCIAIGEGCTNNPADGEKNFGGSLTGKMSKLITTPYANPPSSGVYWVYSGLQHAGFVPQAYAAEGIGFAAIRPFMTLWKVFRDVSYLLLVIVLIAIGFMIMFRMKLNPQTVISIENALPRIVITMILITFSFAIAGFLIDMMYLLIGVSISILSKADPTLKSIDLQNQYLSAPPSLIWDGMFPKNASAGPLSFSEIPVIGGLATVFTLGSAVTSLLPSWIDGSLRVFASVLIPWVVLDFLHQKAGTLNALYTSLDGIQFLGTGIGGLLKPLANTAIVMPILAVIVPLTLIFGSGWLVGILMLFTMLLLFFRIFLLLFTTYIRILLMIIISPLILLFEAVPGKNMFQTWLKGLIADLLTFPLVISIMIFGRVLVNLTFPGAHGVWAPPFIYGIDPKSFSILLGMGIIFMIPDLVKLMRQFLGIKDLPVGLNAGTFFAGVGAGVAGGIGLVGTLSSLRTGLFGLPLQGQGGLVSKLPFISSFGKAFGTQRAGPP